jgi:putative acetyltransferase
MRVREFRVGDEPALFSVFHSAVHQLASRYYTPAQVEAWAPADLDPHYWTARVQAIRPFVVEEGELIIAYADVQANGHIEHFFVRGTHARRGAGRMLMKKIHEVATRSGVAELSSDVSLSAQAFFERFGFHVVERRLPVIRGVALDNALMRKLLVAGR